VKIEAAVVGHVAYLVGSVNYAAQKAEAQDVASRIKGVLIVQNHLTVGSSWPSYVYSDPFSSGIETLKPQPLKSDMQLKRDIERALFWSPFVHRNDIKVTVDNGVATMSGTVGSYLGYNEADRDARKSGAVAVVNRLTIL
jgi:osmotically-inducible protein OsmY